MMDTDELREKAERFRRAALLVTDEDASKAYLDLAARYEATAERLDASSTDEGK